MKLRLVALLAALASPAIAQVTYRYPDLVDRLTNLEALAQLPLPGERTELASSYDRRSQYDATHDRYVAWGANRDGRGYVRMEGDQTVLAEITGPGCIWRLWSATTLKGHVKIYLDGSTEPAIDLPFEQYFSRTTAPFTRPNLVFRVTPSGKPDSGRAGADNYTPISFQKSCRIVADKGWGQYFQCTYTRFPAGTVVPTFKLPLSAEDEAALDRADLLLSQSGNPPNSLQSTTAPADYQPASQLTDQGTTSSAASQQDGPTLAQSSTPSAQPQPGGHTTDHSAAPSGNSYADGGTLAESNTPPLKPVPGRQTESGDLTLEAGHTRTISQLTNSGAITGLRFKIQLPADPDAQRVLLRQLALSIYWDGQSTPAVWAPVGDFFGTIGGTTTHTSYPLGLNPDGTLYSYWYMPFASGARVELANDGVSPATLHWEIDHAALSKPISALARFHAKWHRNELPPRADRAPDWTLLITQGRGRYVGTQLHIFRTGTMWWGEGDDKFFVDDEKFPSTIGTGSEDYFGYAWSSGQQFFTAFTGQPLWTGAQISDYRYHIADSVPFQTSFEGAIEKYIPDPSSQYAATVYWYLSADGKDPFGAKPVADRLDYWVHPAVDPYVIEGEEMTRPIPGTLDRGMFWMWDRDPVPELSAGGATAVSGTAKGQSIDLMFNAPRDGRYAISIACAKGPEGGVFRFDVKGTSASAVLDLRANRLTVAPPVELGTAVLAAGPHQLTITYQGSPDGPAGTKAQAILDYLRLSSPSGPSGPN